SSMVRHHVLLDVFRSSSMLRHHVYLLDVCHSSSMVLACRSNSMLRHHVCRSSSMIITMLTSKPDLDHRVAYRSPGELLRKLWSTRFNEN
ncbi:24107_t:CDS:2, partial [Dentiscutata erythropus]